jgi:hypothetical protein
VRDPGVHRFEGDEQEQGQADLDRQPARVAEPPVAIQEKGGAGGEGEHERSVLDEDDRSDPAARRQLPGLVASAREQHTLGDEGRRQPEDEASDVCDLKEKVDQGGRFRSSLPRAARN